jgi:hypothetical protein
LEPPLAPGFRYKSMLIRAWGWLDPPTGGGATQRNLLQRSAAITLAIWEPILPKLRRQITRAQIDLTVLLTKRAGTRTLGHPFAERDALQDLYMPPRLQLACYMPAAAPPRVLFESPYPSGAVVSLPHPQPTRTWKNANTVRSFSTHGQPPAAKGSSTTVSRSDIRFIQHLDSSAHSLVRRWLLMAISLSTYYPAHLGSVV